MTKEELAEQYANDKSIEFANAVKEAYLKGFEQGQLNASSIKVDGVEYVDFGLPSGLLWGKVEEHMTYAEAKTLNLPTMEQLEELHAHVKFKEYDRSSCFGSSFVKDNILFERQLVGDNGNRIKSFHYADYSGNRGAGGTYIWVKDAQEDEDHMIEVAHYYVDKVYKEKISARKPQVTLLVLDPQK